MMKTFPVRCCCEPQKILGYIDLPQAGGAIRRVPFRPSPQPVTLRQHTIALRLFWSRENGYEFAVHSDDRPLEFWRTIEGFRELSAPA